MVDLSIANKARDFGLRKFIEGRKCLEIPENNLARIIKKDNNSYTLVKEDESRIRAKKIKKDARDYVVGDFVTYIQKAEHVFLEDLLERKNLISKKSSEARKSVHFKEEEQAMAANVDRIFIALACDQRFTISKLERYVATFSIKNAELIILLTKTDLKKKFKRIHDQITGLYPNLKVIPLTTSNGKSFDVLKSLLNDNDTSIIIGASGAGKSTLINFLTGENTASERTNEVRSDGKGKHTTTGSAMIALGPGMGYIIDTPGFKTIDTTKDEKSDELLFQPIYELATSCKFNDCKHDSEPKCAVKEAAKNGVVSQELLRRYRANN